MPNTMPDMVSRPAVVKKSLLGCEWSREVQKLKTTKFQNQPVPKPAGAARGVVNGVTARDSNVPLKPKLSLNLEQQ